MEAGIIRVQDILMGNKFMSEQQILDKYGVKCNFLNVLQLRMSLPGRWRETIVTQDLQLEKDCLFIINTFPEPVNMLEISSKELYWIARDRYSPKLTSQPRWNKFFPGIGIMNDTRETKLQSFQYKIFHRIIACNKYLSDIRVKDNSECMYCDNQPDTIIHFFVSCPKVALFWKTVFRWLNTVLKISTDGIGNFETVLGVTEKSETSDILNLIFLRARFYIYRQRLFHECHLDFLNWLVEFKRSLLSERYICHMDNKMRKFKNLQRILDAI